MLESIKHDKSDINRFKLLSNMLKDILAED